MSRTLQPDDRLAHYRIVSPLGAGGMGEVYLARDERLERSVALKILPPQLVKSEERLRRFVLEAKSASSLNHPNIVTIYDIGQGDVPSGAEGGAPEPVHFISMELVTGDTLAGKIHHEKSDLKTLLGWLAQAAEGLAKAHAAGIIHRDLKPGNIMVTADGYAKVLDFGLAKLTERPAAGGDATEAPTEVADKTADGVILGTAGYMSPEQVQGKLVDHRSDIFAFGCILYEAVTGQRPFTGDSTIETLHKVLHEKPPPVEELNPRAPAELRRLIRRCLAKSPEQRLQSMKDLAIELREIVEEFDNLSIAGSSGATATMTMPAADSGAAAPVTAPARRAGLPPLALAGIVVVTAVAVAFGIWGLKRGRGPAAAPERSVSLSALTSRGDVIEATLSRDGRYLAYTTQAPEANTIWVRQVATGSDVKVYSALGPPPRGLLFSPDGDYLYYIANDPETRGYSALFQVASLGGEPRKRIYDIDSRASLSPDGRSVVFRRGIPARNEVALVIADLESGQEKTLTAVTEPRIFRGDPAWSPDGKLVAMGDTPGEADLKTRLSVFRVSDGRQEKFDSPVWPLIGSVEWFPDGRSLLVAALDLSGSPTFQVYRLSWPEGRLDRLTTGFDNYQAARLSGDGRTIAAVRSVRISNVWMVPVDPPGEPRALTTYSGSENSAFFPIPGPDGTVVFSATQGSYSRLFAIRPGEDQPRQITRDDAHYFNYRVGRDAIIAQRIGADLIPHIWRLDLDGGNGRALTDGPGENIEAIMPDGLSGFFTRSDRPRELQVVPIDGGEPRRLLTDYEGVAEVSPDGRFLHYRTFRRNAGQGDFASGMVSLSGTPVPGMPPPPPSAWDFLWDDSGRYLCWMDRAQPDWPVMRQPVDGGTPERVSRFSEGRVAGYRWTRPGRLAVNRTLGQASNLWLFDTPGGEPRPLTRFPTGRIFEFEWMPDGKQIVATYGTLSQDVVLIKDFQ